ncbi:hypothetical protein HYH03_016970 [Edaphochlamys debaryana]|uniref:Glycosyl hydrolase family 32 N-terminal domain-containing protein n=1 Tax=Edaphochlamys debaryana TaxID=47281 RepID=A0A835XNM7_9CHLO|nr:hypothetical protein HYH03_016970 [Edaphochlamys debaryana]|eukprot:KAG2484235.1 hypothetical protein HYH03_016970 [Edaphochlamys debaryana]
MSPAAALAGGGGTAPRGMAPLSPFSLLTSPHEAPAATSSPFFPADAPAGPWAYAADSDAGPAAAAAAAAAADGAWLLPGGGGSFAGSRQRCASEGDIPAAAPHDTEPLPLPSVAPGPADGGSGGGGMSVTPVASVRMRATPSGAAAAAAPAADSVKPSFHVMPASGWGSDPNGPIFYKGRYHLFFQARPNTCQWYWGMCWDHVVSTDLATWQRLPPALQPSPGGIDADGCFSGSIQVEPSSGIPVCFYTAARLRTNRDVPLPAPPADADMGLKHIETQCCAICDPDDELLQRWRKVPMPLMELPHTGQLTAWRDPWFVEAGDGAGREWTMLIGSGLKGAGGTALVYRSADITRGVSAWSRLPQLSPRAWLKSCCPLSVWLVFMHAPAGWRFEGHLCSWPNPGTGICWECPFLVQLQPLPLCGHVCPTIDLAAVAAAPAAAATRALTATASVAAAAQKAGKDPALPPAKASAVDPVNGPFGHGSWTATAVEATPAAAAAAAATAVAAAAEDASPDAALASAGAAAAVTAAANVNSHAAAAAAASAANVADSVAATDGTDASVTSGLHDGTTLSTAGSGTADGRASSDVDGLSVAAETFLDRTYETSPPLTAPPLSRRNSTTLAAGLVDTLLHVVTASPAVAEAADGASGIDISVTAASPHDGGGGAADSTVTITVTRHHGGGGDDLTAAAAGSGGGADGSVTTAIATVHAAADASSPATATIQVLVNPTVTDASPFASAADGTTAPSTPSAAASTAGFSRAASLTSSAVTASATLPTAAAADRAVRQDLHSMIAQVMEAHRARRQGALPAPDGLAGGDTSAAAAVADRPAAATRYSPGVVGHCAAPEPDIPVMALPGGAVTMRYHKAQPLAPPPACIVAAKVAGGAAAEAVGGGGEALPSFGSAARSSQCVYEQPCVPLHGDVDSASTHAHAPLIEERRRWFFCTAPDACTYSIIYWISEYDSGSAKFDLEGAEAAGRPRKLDMGNGRNILWGYMKELRNVPAPPCLCNKYSYAGCVSLPRALYLRGEKLFQLPLPELTSLRTDVAAHVGGVELRPGCPWRLAGVRGLHLDIELAVSPGTARRTVLLLHSWRPRGRGAAALVYDWPSRRLFVVFDTLAPGRQALWGGEDEPVPQRVSTGCVGGAEEGKVEGPEPCKGLAGAPGEGGWAACHHPQGTPHVAGSGGCDQGALACDDQGCCPLVECTALPAELAWEGAAGAKGAHAPRPHEGIPAGAASGEECEGGEGASEDEEENNDFETIRDPDFIPDPDMNPLVEDWIRMKRDEAGGILDLPPGAPLRLRLFLDASALEVFTGTGQALTTRVYRGHPPACPPPSGPDPGIELRAVGGCCVLDDLHAYEVQGCWDRPQDAPDPDE